MHGIGEGEVDRWYPKLFHTALRLTGNYSDAQDLTQQAFFKAIRRCPALARPASITWMYTILINCVRDHFRKGRHRSAESFDNWDALPAEGNGASHNLALREEAERLRRRIRTLPESKRAAFVLVMIDEYSYREAADLLGVPIGTVASRVHQARRILAESVSEHTAEA